MKTGKPLIWIGWESASWSVLDSLVDSGRMPNLERLLSNSTRSILVSKRPLARPVLWTTAATGASGDQHLLVTDAEPDGRGGFVPTGTRSRQTDAVWNYLSQKGSKCCVVGWPFTDSSDVINGLLVPERWATGGDGDRFSKVFPNEKQDEIDQLFIHPDELGSQTIDELLEGVSDPGSLSPNLIRFMTHAVAATSSIHNAATWAAESQHWDLLAVAYPLAGVVSRKLYEVFCPDGNTLSPNQARVIRAIESNCWRLLDLMLGRLVELAPKASSVVLFSECGLRSGSLEKLPEDYLSRKIPHEVNRLNRLRRNCETGIFVVRDSQRSSDQLMSGVFLSDIANVVCDLLGFHSMPSGSQQTRFSTSHELTADPWDMHELMEELQELGFVDTSPNSLILEDLRQQRSKNLAESAFYVGRFERALSYLQQNFEQEETITTKIMILECLLATNKLTEAQLALEQVGFFNQYLNVVRALRAQLHLLKGEKNEAIEYMNLVAKSDINAEVGRTLGQCAVKWKQWDVAIRLLSIAVNSYPEEGATRNLLGIALLNAGRCDEAVEQHRLAIGNMCDLAFSHHCLAKALYASGDLEGSRVARRAAEKFRSEQPLRGSIPSS